MTVNLKKVFRHGMAVSMIALLIALCFSLTACDMFSRLGSKTDDPMPHLITADQREANPIRPIDSAAQSVVITKVDDSNVDIERQLFALYGAVQSGKKPLLLSASTAVRNVYDKAIALLNNIILNDMTDYDRVHAIHDYLAYYIEYNTELYNSFLAGENINEFDPSFDVRGVFINQVAVCEGIAEAFVLLCGIENIRAVVVAGDAFSGGANIDHAWNRVFIEEEWYNIDCTFASLYVNDTSNNTTKGYLNHAYFLVDTDSMIGHNPKNILDTDGATFGYIEDGNESNYDANSYYGYYREISGSNAEIDLAYSYDVADQAALNALFNKVYKSPKVGKIEVRISFAQGDAAKTALRLAYAECPNSSYPAESGSRELVNGVYFCFIYQ